MYKLLLLFLSCFFLPSANAYENLLYTWRSFPTQIQEGKIALQDLQFHHAQIDILSSQAYHIDATGHLSGTTNPAMDKIANNTQIKILPLVGNNNFNAKLTHLFLTNTAAQTRAIQSVLQICQQHHYAGVQIDFEGMHILDRDAFTHFYQAIAAVLHQHHFQVAIAMIPTLTNDSSSSNYLQSRYNYWSGVYDYKALGESSDFVTLMTYDQHGSITPPGPMAGIHWCKTIIEYALQTIPAQKISLGIPLHSAYWFAGKEYNPATTTVASSAPIHVVSTDLSYADTLILLHKNHLHLRWDEQDQIPYVFFINHYLYEYIFAENAQSFKAKIALVKKYKLRGVSLWCLGEEDPNIWDILKKR